MDVVSRYNINIRSVANRVTTLDISSLHNTVWGWANLPPDAAAWTPECARSQRDRETAPARDLASDRWIVGSVGVPSPWVGGGSVVGERANPSRRGLGGPIWSGDICQRVSRR